MQPPPTTRAEEGVTTAAPRGLSERTIGTGVLVIALLLGAVLRLRLALTTDGIFWPDEVYNSLEPAHRLAFGYGLLPWEYVDGARSWVLPALLAVPLKLPGLLGLTAPDAYVMLVRLLLVGLSLATVWATYRLALADGAGRIAAAVGASVLAVLPLAVYFSDRAFSEVVSMLPITLAFALALRRGATSRAQLFAALLLSLAVMLRLHNVLFCGALVLVLLMRHQWRAALVSTAGLAVGLGILGLVDAATWGSPFQSAITYVQYTAFSGGAARWGTGSVAYYPIYLFSATWPAGLLLFPLALLGFARARGLSIVVVIYLAAHLVTPHKELRFLLPLLPFVCALAAAGLEVTRPLFRRVPFAVLTAALLMAAAIPNLLISSVTFGDLGAYLGVPAKAAGSILDAGGPENRLLLRANRQADLCGLRVESETLANVGGYTYLHRDVPLYDLDSPGTDSGSYNYVIAPSGAGAGEVVAADGLRELVRVSAGCPHPAGPTHVLNTRP